MGAGKREGGQPTRREIIQVAGTLGVTSLLGCGRSPSQGDPAPFPIGVASGDVRTQDALLWTRYDGFSPLRMTVWEGEPESGAPVVSTGAAPGAAGYVLSEITGLQPGRRYSFQFEEERLGGEKSRVGRFRTAFAEDSEEPLLFAATSCTRFGFPMDTLERLSEQNGLDVAVMLGDNVYADGASTTEQFREQWATTLKEPGQRAFRAAAGLIATWDDHEIGNNWSIETVDAQRFERAAGVFFEHQPIRRSPDAPGRLWRSLRWGRTAEFFVLDARGERRPSTRLSANAEYLSRAQLDWLKAGLAASPAAFKIIVNSVPISEYPGLFFQLPVNDRWEGYPAQRDEILRFVDGGIRGVVWVAGDFHLGSLGRVSRQGPGSSQLEILVGPAANAPNPSPSYPTAPQSDFTTGINNFGLFVLDPRARTMRVSLHDGSGKTLVERNYGL